MPDAGTDSRRTTMSIGSFVTPSPRSCDLQQCGVLRSKRGGVGMTDLQSFFVGNSCVHFKLDDLLGSLY